MRQVVKGAPLNNVSTQADTRRSWQNAQKDLKKDLRKKEDPHVRSQTARAAYEDIPSEKMRVQLLKEQKHLCVFCECRIANAPPTANTSTGIRIAHWVPLSVSPESALDWKNLYASCSTRISCDALQGDRELGIPRPADFDYSQVIRFSRNGRMFVDETHVKGRLTTPEIKALEQVMFPPPPTKDGSYAKPSKKALRQARERSTLNLNHQALQEARKAALDTVRAQIQRKFPQRRATKEERHQMADTLLELEKRPPFVSIRVAWLKEEMTSPNTR